MQEKSRFSHFNNCRERKFNTINTQLFQYVFKLLNKILNKKIKIIENITFTGGKNINQIDKY